MDSLVSVFSTKDRTCVLLLDGLMYACNIGLAIRHASLLGASAIIISPPDEHRQEEIRIRKARSDKRKSSGLNDYGVYSNNFIKNIKRYSQRFHEDIKVIFNLPSVDVIDSAKKYGFQVFAFENYGKTKCVTKTKISNFEKVMFVIGNETVGIGRYENVDCLKIPSWNNNGTKKKDSYNASHVCTIVMWEWRRQHQEEKKNCEENIFSGKKRKRSLASSLEGKKNEKKLKL